MKKLFTIISLFAIVGVSTIAAKSKSKSEKIEKIALSDEAISSNVATLMAKMTLKEKIGQLTQPVLFPEDLEQIKDSISKGGIGSFCTIDKTPPSPEVLNELQRVAVEDSRLGIPILFGYDVIHGFNTIFPVVLGMAASWDDAMIERASSLAATEARSCGIHMAFSPMVDVSRDARWGRIVECAGEDVLLNERMGAATVKGYQKGDISRSDALGACVKHFVGYGMALGGRDKQFTEISDNSLLNVYLPPFEACVKAGAISVMSAFNDISGTPASANHYTETEILKEKWGFDGFVLSDWDAVVELINHGIVADDKDAAAAAFNAGTDVEMKSSTFAHMEELVNEGKVSIDKIDDAVRRILTIKYRLGLFENPYVDGSKPNINMVTEDSRKVAREVASQCMILLKNDKNTLPLNQNTGNVAVTGKYSHSTDLYGHWDAQGRREDVITAFAGLKANQPSGITIVDATKNSAENSKCAIVCIGEPSSHFGESNDMMDITISDEDIEAVKDAKAKYGKVVAVVFCGRPMVLTPINDIADAILVAWHGGVETGNALADIVYGTVCPTAKTTTTFLRHPGQAPTFYSDRVSGRPREDNYSDGDHTPLYPFGYGLNYTTFTYTNLRVSSSSMAKDGYIEVAVDVRNSGRRASSEIVQLYTHDIVASITRPQIELKDYQKVFIKQGGVKTVRFKLKAEQLSFYNRNLEKVVESGEFDLWVGGSSQSLLHKNFVVE